MSFKISIILPIFNVETYLPVALDSIVNQTFNLEDLEILMVDDCSTDNSGKIIDEYAEKYDNFIAIHLDENSRTAGKPRNTGLNQANGEYIMFLDSDDEFVVDICETLYNKIVETDADIVTGNAICIQGNITFQDINYPENYYEFNPNKDFQIFKPFRIWGTLYKKSLINDNNIRCIRASTNDDTHFIYNCYLNANKIVYLNDYYGVKYYDRIDEDNPSLTHDISKFNILTTFNAFCEILKLIKDSNPTKDYINDPFISLIYGRFNYKWDFTKEDKIEIFEKILEYESISDYNLVLPFHFKIMDSLLNRGRYSLLILTQKLYASFVLSRFSKKYLIPRFKHNIVE